MQLMNQFFWKRWIPKLLDQIWNSRNKDCDGFTIYGRAGWGEDWLFYKDIFKVDPMMADDVDFIIYSKDNRSKKKYGFNNVATVRKRLPRIKN